MENQLIYKPTMILFGSAIHIRDLFFTNLCKDCLVIGTCLKTDKTWELDEFGVLELESEPKDRIVERIPNYVLMIKKPCNKMRRNFSAVLSKYGSIAYIGVSHWFGYENVITYTWLSRSIKFVNK